MITPVISWTLPPRCQFSPSWSSSVTTVTSEANRRGIRPQRTASVSGGGGTRVSSSWPRGRARTRYLRYETGHGYRSLQSDSSSTTEIKRRDMLRGVERDNRSHHAKLDRTERDGTGRHSGHLLIVISNTRRQECIQRQFLTIASFNQIT